MQMRLALLLAAVACLVSPPASAADWAPPTAWETIPMVAAGALITVDVMQSIDSTHHPDRYGESNFFLGDHPSPEMLVAAGVFVAGSGAIAWWYLPPKYRWIVPSVLIVAETIAVVHNAQIGLSVRF